ncbi:MAG: XrtA/PEP-CTERM system-associated ATPase [Gammaproteobacteria bacterium]|jgi:putative secretion ATPase (PEP-CTERM system associated)
MYESFYRLRTKPFQLSPDPRFFFNSQVHKRALAYLRYGVKQGEGFIIITGDVGTGKSMLVSTLFKSLETEDVVAAQVVSTQLKADDLLRVVASAYGLPYHKVSKAGLLMSLESFFQACVQEGKRVLLVVDEAQGLPRQSIEELRMLSNFQMDGRALLQSFLLGQKEFRATLRSEGFEQLRQRVIAAYHLKSLGPDETRGYIDHRLITAGWQGDPQFTDQAYLDIHEYTNGIPRRINTLCDRLFLYGCLEELHEINRDAVAAVTEDMLEEQGGAEVNPVEGRNGAEVQSAAVQHKAGANGLREFQRAGASSPMGAPPGEHAPRQAERLASVEHSMAALANIMRDELAQLRKELRTHRRQNGEED